jgi:hypothetical protein
LIAILLAYAVHPVIIATKQDVCISKRRRRANRPAGRKFPANRVIDNVVAIKIVIRCAEIQKVAFADRRGDKFAQAGTGRDVITPDFSSCQRVYLMQISVFRANESLPFSRYGVEVTGAPA